MIKPGTLMARYVNAHKITCSLRAENDRVKNDYAKLIQKYMMMAHELAALKDVMIREKK